MQVSIEQELASIVRFIEANLSGLDKIFERIPEDFHVPSVFFPMPELTAKKMTMQTMRTTMTWYIKFFASSDVEAYTLASTIESLILYRNCHIPLYAEDGTEEEKTLPVTVPEVIKVDYGVYQIKIACERYTGIYKNTGTDSSQIQIDGPGFFGEVLDAYRSVIARYETKKEVDKIGSSGEEERGEEGDSSEAEVCEGEASDELRETLRGDNEHL